jgi:hypothetical protein
MCLLTTQPVKSVNDKYIARPSAHGLAEQRKLRALKKLRSGVDIFIDRLYMPVALLGQSSTCFFLTS